MTYENCLGCLVVNVDVNVDQRDSFPPPAVLNPPSFPQI